jgi:hypothetical protein
MWTNSYTSSARRSRKEVEMHIAAGNAAWRITPSKIPNRALFAARQKRSGSRSIAQKIARSRSENEKFPRDGARAPSRSVHIVGTIIKDLRKHTVR